MNVLFDLFKELEESLHKSESDVSEKIVSSIENVLSDCHIVQFNSVFQDYRSSVLPHIIESWNLMNEESQKNFSRINEFFEVYISSLVWLIKPKLH